MWFEQCQEEFPLFAAYLSFTGKDFTRSGFQITDECKLTLALHKLRKSLLLFVQYMYFFFQIKRVFIKKH